ncbi:glycerol kinase [Mobilisporobacter senegalensis]|uniref:ATP:glycerol 3-phosphotransferase n=2 Tax=Mobilisporobacter senegalensis TaxID=1329262 RepID=A0A3N1XZL3_9FIRM|nr:glycerol kinase [Mobilisporobacter senegalensis]
MMSDKYILGIDQSTSGTKALLFDEDGGLIARSDLPHDQLISEQGWVEHNPIQIYENTLDVVREVVKQAGIDKNNIVGVGISNQRETAMVWERHTGNPVYNAIVWQCARGEAICNEIERAGHKDIIKSRTGLHLSPYFSGAKLSWILKNVDGTREEAEKGELCCGTMDSWLVYKLTGGVSFKTDYSNASRTQLFNILELKWDEEICKIFEIPVEMLPEVCDSNGFYGETDFTGFLDHKVPIRGVLGDSHGALFGQGCLKKGMIKATYGTGSSIMMNIGKEPVFSQKGIVTSLAYSMNGEVNYVLEGNINYTGAVIKWLIENVGLIQSARESEELAKAAKKEDKTYLVPGFTGLGAPYWDSNATAHISGMTRTTGKAEIVKAAVESIAYQIGDIVKIMSEESGVTIRELRVDGGPTRNEYLMQFQSDLLGIGVQVPDVEELSGIGAAYLAGITLGIYEEEKLFARMERKSFNPVMNKRIREIRYQGWKDAVLCALSRPGM